MITGNFYTCPEPRGFHLLSEFIDLSQNPISGQRGVLMHEDHYGLTLTSWYARIPVAAGDPISEGFARPKSDHCGPENDGVILGGLTNIAPQKVIARFKPMGEFVGAHCLGAISYLLCQDSKRLDEAAAVLDELIDGHG
jgi:hypothetical protein